ncbi:MAG: nuclear transport factor 2 family protein [Bauldia sp.]|nr:nuclear transport factor 2 family protein [Bauldia sp.]
MAKEYTQQEKDNIQVVHRWLDLYNNDAERLVREIYASDTVVKTMGAGTYTGTDHFLQIERDVLKAAPRRKFRLNHVHADGNTCIVEVTLLNPDDKRFGDKYELHMAAIMEIENGQIKRDRSYHNIGSEYPLWPGLEEADPNKPK